MAFSGEVNYFGDLSAMGLRQPQLGIPLCTSEASNLPNSTAELKREGVELFETAFPPINEDVSKMERVLSSDASQGNDGSGKISGSFDGADGAKYVAKRVTPQKKPNKTGDLQSYRNNARYT